MAWPLHLLVQDGQENSSTRKGNRRKKGRTAVVNPKIIFGAAIIIIFIAFGSYSFLESNLEYTDIDGAVHSGRKVQLKGTWNRERESHFDPAKTQFSFYLVDDAGKECRVVLEGAAPNNFDLATSVVAKGRYDAAGGYFHATEVLTKCPSKYEADGEEVKRST
jgi:cytochrome c-type biogenesis protein CcmE